MEATYDSPAHDPVFFFLAHGRHRKRNILFKYARWSIYSTDEFGYGAHHWNSLILSHVYYLAVEGGTHRTSGMTVEGIGGANREEMERIFFHAMRDLMPAAASLPIAAAVLRQAAVDLAPGSEAERALDQALHAVGLPPDTEDLQE